MKALYLNFRDVLFSFFRHKCPVLAAALSYYMLFTIGPFLAIILAVAGFFFGREAVSERFFGHMQALVGAGGAEMMQTVLAKAAEPKAGLLAATLGVGALFFGTTGVVMQIQDALNVIWEAQPKTNSGWLRMLRNRFVSFGIILGMGFLLLVTLLLNSMLDVLGEYLAARFSALSVLVLEAAGLALAFGASIALFMMIFKTLPEAPVRWRDASIGAFITAVLFAVGRVLIGLYLGKSNVTSTYGAAASLVILVLWIHYSSMILFFGAECTKKISVFGTAKHPKAAKGALGFSVT